MELEQLRQQVLTLPFSDRASLVRDLIVSLNDGDDHQTHTPAWIDEIIARSDAVRDGECHGDDWRTSLERVEQMLAARTSS